ncbi:MAG: glycoside hydrolase family 127 protein, partial [Thermoguttaceae bacterium]|nr:glycoside hydrolase family 127 protein [Thermoguttaceae bacterium]
MGRAFYARRLTVWAGISISGAWALVVSNPWLLSPGIAATVQERYYAHAAVHDKYGVIAPWYQGQNGQLDFRVRIAAETLKRYPWVEPPAAVCAAPHYVFNGHWKIDPDGTITPVPIGDWDNGDLGQRAAYILSAMVDYYRYTGDPAAIAIMTLQADALIDHCCTPADHPWPKFLISVPVKGKPYGKCDPAGMIQLDIVAEVGVPLLRAYQITGNKRWFEAAKHWGDLLAAKRDRTPSAAPWGRYANPEAAPWRDVQQTGGVVFLAYFFDELIRLGYTGKDGEIVNARDAARAYLRDVLLPAWTVHDTWGRNYWDWNCPVQVTNVTEFAARYMMDNKEAFPNWRNDVRNILSLFLNRTSVDPGAGGEVYSGAWAFPESPGCCGRSLWYAPMEVAPAFAQYGVEAQSSWARELARRMQILATYDGHETGVSEDNIDGGFIVNSGWFKIAHPMALKHLLATIAWMPEEFGPARENHLVNSTSVVTDVWYSDRLIEYTTFDAPPGTIATLRVKCEPEAVFVPDTGQRLPKRESLDQNGYTVKPVENGDAVVKIRHDGIRRLAVLMPKLPEDSQASAGPIPDQPQVPLLALSGEWSEDGPFRVSDQAGASATVEFVGNQVRVLGNTGPDGGLAEVYLDGVKQLVHIDCWNPSPRKGTLYYRNGLPNTRHTLKIVVLGKKNPVSKGTKVWLHSVEWSAATGRPTFGEGG